MRKEEVRRRGGMCMDAEEEDGYRWGRWGFWEVGKVDEDEEGRRKEKRKTVCLV